MQIGIFCADPDFKSKSRIVLALNCRVSCDSFNISNINESLHVQALLEGIHNKSYDIYPFQFHLNTPIVAFIWSFFYPVVKKGVLYVLLKAQS